MEVKLTRIDEDEAPCQLTITLPEGMIVLSGTPGLVIGGLRALFASDSTIRALIFEHISQEDFAAAWRQAALDAGLDMPPLET